MGHSGSSTVTSHCQSGLGRSSNQLQCLSAGTAEQYEAAGDRVVETNWDRAHLTTQMAPNKHGASWPLGTFMPT